MSLMGKMAPPNVSSLADVVHLRGYALRLLQEVSI